MTRSIGIVRSASHTDADTISIAMTINIVIRIVISIAMVAIMIDSITNRYDALAA
jgi:hypothetical protein